MNDLLNLKIGHCRLDYSNSQPTKGNIMDLDSAIQKHGEWKTKFRSAISRQETVDADTVAKDNCCDLGKWLYGEAKTKYSNLSSYKDCVARHTSFHSEAGKVATLINRKKFTEAEVALGVGSKYLSASSDVAVAIMRLKKEANI